METLVITIVPPKEDEKYIEYQYHPDTDSVEGVPHPLCSNGLRLHPLPEPLDPTHPQYTRVRNIGRRRYKELRRCKRKEALRVKALRKEAIAIAKAVRKILHAKNAEICPAIRNDGVCGVPVVLLKIDDQEFPFLTL